MYLEIFQTIALSGGGAWVTDPPYPRAVKWRNLASGPQSGTQELAGLFSYEESYAGIYRFDSGKAIWTGAVGGRGLDLCLYSEAP